MTRSTTLVSCLNLIACMLLSISACGNGPTVVKSLPTLEPATPVDQPQVLEITVDKTAASNYTSVEFTLALKAGYGNPYDIREVNLTGIFTAPDGKQMTVPGFWDGEEAWKIRFTPSQVGLWKYEITVKDANGISDPATGELSVTPSDRHGWIVSGNAFDLSFSPRYLVYHDGTPFYGVGYCEALNILIDGYDAVDGVGLFDNMKKARANYVVWWPMYTNSIVSSKYDDYSLQNLKIIDAIVKDAEKEDVLLVFTIWDHPNLRDATHAWGDGNWERNGFSKLGDINSFFVSEEAWAWQVNMYRYIIARWGYSTSIGMWQTVSEINGTNAYSQTDAWHERVNNYFIENDPYRHPTTASGSGEVDWPQGYAVMDMPQMHIYDFPDNDVVQAADIIAGWTERMAGDTGKPNWIGEFGVKGNNAYPELFHNSIWAALGAGASMTPAEWNSGGTWGRMTPEMHADLERLAVFVSDLPLAAWNPMPLQVTPSDPQVRGWGSAGQDGGILWIQDYSLTGASIEDVRTSMPVRSGIQVELKGMVDGTYIVTPFDTWQGNFLESYEVECSADTCTIPVAVMRSDMAFRLVRK